MATFHLVATFHLGNSADAAELSVSIISFETRQYFQPNQVLGNSAAFFPPRG